MSDPIQETTETNSSRRKGLEAWAASIAARQRPPETAPPEQDGSGAAYARPDTSQRLNKVKAVTKIQKNHQSQKNSDGVELSRQQPEQHMELSLKDARRLVKTVGRSKAEAATKSKPVPTPPTELSKSNESKTKKAVEQANRQEVAEEAQNVTAEEVQQNPGVVSTVGQKSAKSTGKSEETKTTESSAHESEVEEHTSLIEPGNDPRASAYVRAGDYLSGDSGQSDLDDYMLAL